MKNRVIAMGTVVGFFALVTTNANPAMWQVALISVCIYEVVLMVLNILDGVPQKKSKKTIARNVRYRHEDAERVADQVFNPLRRMREVS